MAISILRFSLGAWFRWMPNLWSLCKGVLRCCWGRGFVPSSFVVKGSIRSAGCVASSLAVLPTEESALSIWVKNVRPPLCSPRSLHIGLFPALVLVIREMCPSVGLREILDELVEIATQLPWCLPRVPCICAFVHDGCFAFVGCCGCAWVKPFACGDSLFHGSLGVDCIRAFDVFRSVFLVGCGFRFCGRFGFLCRCWVLLPGRETLVVGQLPCRTLPRELLSL